MILYAWWLVRSRGDELIEEPELVSVFSWVCVVPSVLFLFLRIFLNFQLFFCIVTPIETFNFYPTGVVLNIQIIFILYCCLGRVIELLLVTFILREVLMVSFTVCTMSTRWHTFYDVSLIAKYIVHLESISFIFLW